MLIIGMISWPFHSYFLELYNKVNSGQFLYSCAMHCIFLFCIPNEYIMPKNCQFGLLICHFTNFQYFYTTCFIEITVMKPQDWYASCEVLKLYHFGTWQLTCHVTLISSVWYSNFLLIELDFNFRFSTTPGSSWKRTEIHCILKSFNYSHCATANCLNCLPLQLIHLRSKVL